MNNEPENEEIGVSIPQNPPPKPQPEPEIWGTDEHTTYLVLDEDELA